MTKYVIKKPSIGGGYLTYPNTKVAIIYDERDPKLEFDLKVTKGAKTKVDGEVFAEIFYGIRYNNVLPRESKVREEFQLELRGFAKDQDRRQMSFVFSPA